jgi:hypothetical protein
MAKMSFDTAVSTMNNEGNNNGSSVKIFSLKNDGDEAIVRIMHDSVNDFDILTTHPITVGGKYRSISCLREPRDPMDNCPLCKNGTKVQSRIFIHMIQYVTNAQGQIEAQPVIWERSIAYATKLKNDIDEYGPLSNCIFKIRRNGKAGDMQTTYDMRLGNPSMYNEANYPKVEDAFKDYNVCGTLVLDKTYDEISMFMANGSFPETNKPTNTTTTAPVGLDAVEDNVPNTATPRESWTAPTTGGYIPNGTTGMATGTPNRPTRYY